MRGSTGQRWLVVVLLVGTALVGGAHPASAATPTNGADVAARDALGLLRYVPEGYRSACQVWDADRLAAAIAPQAASLQGAVACTPERGLTVYFTRYRTRAAMDAAYDGFLTGGDFGEFAAGSDCGGDSTYDVRGETVGRWACYQQDPARLQLGPGDPLPVQINWTDGRSAVLGSAVRGDGDDAALYEWWSGSDAGPLTKPTNRGIPAPLTASEQRRVGKRLLRAVPRELRTSCAPADVNDPDATDPAEFASRIFVRAVVRCSPASGVTEVRYFALPDAASAAGLVTAYAGTAEVGPDDCPTAGTYRVGGKRAGTYRCWFHGDPAAAVVMWSHHDLAVVGLARRADGDSDALLDWWRESGGPVT